MADDIDRASEVEALQRAAAISFHRLDPNAVSSEECDECGDKIEEARRRAYPGCRLCVSCKGDQEARSRHLARN